MSEKQLDLLRELYSDPSTGLSSSKLYKKAHSLDPKITQAMVKKFLKDTEVGQVFAERKVKYYPLTADRPFQKIQIDLQDMSAEHVVNNRRNVFIFVAIDRFSRYLFCYPQKSKNISECVSSLKKLILDVGKKGFEISQIDSDAESAFMSREFQKILKENDITHNVNTSDTKHSTGIVERVIKTLRSLINRYKLVKRTTDWVTGLPLLVKNYNNTDHRSLGTTPEDAVESGEGIQKYISKQTKKADAQHYNQVEYKVGDRVRHKLIRTIFEKGTKEQFSKTIHTVEKIVGRDIWISGMSKPYSKESLMLVKDVEEAPEEYKQAEEEVKEQQREKRINRRINKEQIERKDEDKPEEIEARQLRKFRKPRELGFYFY